MADLNVDLLVKTCVLGETAQSSEYTFRTSSGSRIDLSRLFLALIALVLVGATIGPSIPLANATTHSGKVCVSIVDRSCPTDPQLFTGLPGSTIRVNVVVDSADSFDGFGVWVRTDPTVIRAVQVDMTGSVLKALSTTLQCVNDCTSWLSGGPGAVAEKATGQPTSFHTTGLLFSIVYLVVGNISSSSPISLYYTVSPSGWETDRVYLHFSDGCDTMNCWFVPVQSATFHAGTAITGQPFPVSFAGNYKSLPLLAITGGAFAAGLAILLSIIYKRQRLRSSSGRLENNLTHLE